MVVPRGRCTPRIVVSAVALALTIGTGCRAKAPPVADGATLVPARDAAEPAPPDIGVTADDLTGPPTAGVAGPGEDASSVADAAPQLDVEAATPESQPELIPLMGGRLLAQLPLDDESLPRDELPGRILACHGYTADAPKGWVEVTGLDLDAVVGEDLEQAVQAELILQEAPARVRGLATTWAVSPCPTVRPPLRAVRVVPSANTGYLCGPGAVDVILTGQARFFVALPDATVVILDFSYPAEFGLTPEWVESFAADVMASLVPGPVVMAREAGTRILPNLLPGQDLEIELPADTVVSVEEGTDSTTLRVGPLRPLGTEARPRIVTWSHSCEGLRPWSGRTGISRVKLFGLQADLERGREQGWSWESILIADEDYCTSMTIWAEATGGLEALHETLAAGRLLRACTSDSECGGRPCVDRRCPPGTPLPAGEEPAP